MNLIIFAIPVFFLLIGLELLLTRLRHLPYYRFNDAITNLSCGIGSQIAGVFIRFLTVGAYAALHANSPFRDVIETNVVTALLLFIGVDFFYYWFHRLAHEVAILWGSHVVHHQSEEYNLTVALRQAWFQGAFSWVFYLPLAFLGFDTRLFLTVASIQTLYQFWIHTRLIDRMPAWFEYVFNTPSHHRVHHGVNPIYIDRNHGGTLIIFDRIFGTFQEEQEEVVYGITTQPRSWNPLWLNFEYWTDLFRSLFRVRQVSDAARLLVLAPGWRPSSLGGSKTYRPVSPASFHKYDTTISPSLTHYILFQFISVLLCATAFLFTEKLYPHWTQKAIVAVLIIWAVADIGGLFEKRPWVIVAEILRLLAVLAVAVWIGFRQHSGPFLLASLLSYFTVSLVWLIRVRPLHDPSQNNN